ncbi:hypothetical protein O9G_001469 [Rozella allomycis CSF55]|uniref:Uncharacterized protein n=1 Tax=Rozella allomycis (strain CSF55) TaxID=988480 RepID=A0A075AMT4_ROZAC|nr:hypothetical protein O9G_001469 [Rozella allomycis CSF55]|eukprot:EPZ30996.1 hypothetical protein O9G_001469 [Rozella allomycis CSF55]
MSEYYKNIPEVIEFEIGTAITTRNEAIESFKDLGPIDLVHVVKTLKKENREIRLEAIIWYKESIVPRKPNLLSRDQVLQR